MPSCFLCGRSKDAKSKSDDITFHKFPLSNRVLMEKWNDILLDNSRSSNNLTKNSVICSRHFDPSNLINYKSKRLLKQNAVPSLNIVRAKSAKKKYPEFIHPCSTSNSNISLSFVKVSSSNISLKCIEKLDNFSDSSNTSISNSPLPSVTLLQTNVETPDPMDTPSSSSTGLHHGRVKLGVTADAHCRLYKPRSQAALSLSGQATV